MERTGTDCYTPDGMRIFPILLTVLFGLTAIGINRPCVPGQAGNCRDASWISCDSDQNDPSGCGNTSCPDNCDGGCCLHLLLESRSPTLAVDLPRLRYSYVNGLISVRLFGSPLLRPPTC